MMAQNEQILERELVRGVHVFRLRMRMLEDAAALMALEQELEHVLQAEEVSPKVVINLGSVEYLVTIALVKLVSFKKRIGARGGSISLCSLQPAVREVMEITRFDELFKIYDSEPQAIEKA